MRKDETKPGRSGSIDSVAAELGIGTSAERGRLRGTKGGGIMLPLWLEEYDCEELGRDGLLELTAPESFR